MSETTQFEMTTDERLDAIEEAQREINRKLDVLVTFCDRAAQTAEKLSAHPMMASFFPGGVKRQ